MSASEKLKPLEEYRAAKIELERAALGGGGLNTNWSEESEKRLDAAVEKLIEQGVRGGNSAVQFSCVAPEQVAKYIMGR